MKLLLFICLAILATAYAGDQEEAEHDFMYFPDGYGNIHLIDLKEKVDESDIDLRNSNIIFNLHTRNNRGGQVLEVGDVNSLRNSDWDGSRQTIFITHGWKSASDAEACTAIRDAYLDTGDYNVIVVDWSAIASSAYIIASSRVRTVGNHVATMLDFLAINGGLSQPNTKLIGHSLGGHIVGLAARAATGTVGYVVGLDPAMPNFQSAEAGSRIDKTDAAHVQVIHTNGGMLGLMQAVGDSDFYPNGGSSQPGCGFDLVGSCAHSRAYLYLAESIRNPTGFRSLLTTRSTSPNAFFGRTDVFMGGPVLSTHADGSYTLTTARSSPFALG